ncbi:hypothetical protein [Paenarthrobacter nicotinovorans]|uniref:hypothetical protein n=1 Tax=Paenarthrobacter nicotinovorans TaxID=29320 RepID=UPI0004B7E607|nr:hypothetical protein [Paenarthrobacter nicotinovorans]
MGIEDSIRKTAENAMEDLAGTSDPVNNDRVPEPGEKDDDVQVHSSISEGSNSMDSDVPGENDDPRTGGHAETGTTHGTASHGTASHGTDSPETTDDAGTRRDSEADTDVSAASGDVSGPAGLPQDDPDDLRADPSEGGGDPSTSMGRG